MQHHSILFLPKQTDIDKILETIIRKKVLNKGMHLPFDDKTETSQAHHGYLSSLYFKDIY